MEEYFRKLKIVVERHEDGFIAYPLGVDGAIVGEGDTFEDALRDVRSAIREYVDVFGVERLNIDAPVLDATVIDSASAM
jgi:predicted RNase H-like HicB family nuclease